MKERRYEIILDQINKHGSVSLNELAVKANSSRSTVRRDIYELEKKHLLKCVRGGAVSISGTVEQIEPSFSVREDLFADEKARIARYAHDLVKPGETLILDSGTTIHEFSKTLYDISPLYVATNDLKSATELAHCTNIDLVVLGGSLRKNHFSLHGYFTDNMIMQLHADRAFIGVDGIDFNLGLMNFSSEEVQSKKLMMQVSKQVIVLCDHSKFDKIAFINICSLNKVDLLITGKETEQKYIDNLNSLGIKAIQV